MFRLTGGACSPYIIFRIRYSAIIVYILPFMCISFQYMCKCVHVHGVTIGGVWMRMYCVRLESNVLLLLMVMLTHTHTPWIGLYVWLSLHTENASICYRTFAWDHLLHIENCVLLCHLFVCCLRFARNLCNSDESGRFIYSWNHEWIKQGGIDSVNENKLCFKFVFILYLKKKILRYSSNIFCKWECSLDDTKYENTLDNKFNLYYREIQKKIIIQWCESHPVARWITF